MARAYELAVTEYDFETAEKLMKTARAAASNKALVVDWYCVVALAPQRRFEEARTALREAERADPLSKPAKAWIGGILVWQGHYDEAVTKFGEALALNPVDIMSSLYMPVAQARLGRFEEAETSLRRLEDLIGDDNDVALFSRALVHIAKGEDTDAERLRQQQIVFYDLGILGAAQRIGDVTARLGLIDEAIDWFERAAEADTAFKLWIPAHSTDIPELWNHPRFQAVLEKMNLDDASIAALEAAAAGE